MATLQLKDPKPMVTASDAEKKFEWLGTTPLNVVKGSHYFMVEELGEKQVRFVHGEQFTGILAGPFHRRLAEPRQDGFMEMNKTLKERAEFLSDV